MVFSSLNFLFLFLPLVMILHYVVPMKWKNPVLLAASIYFYAWGEPVYVLLMLLNIGFNYVTGLQLNLTKDAAKRKRALIGGIVVNLFTLGFFKYYGFLIETVNSLTGLKLTVHELALPIGISFYTFQALSYVVDVYRGTCEAQTNIVSFATYITMFPQLVAGPIVQYSDIRKQLTKRTVPFVKFGQGAERLIFGLAKKVLLANNLGLLYTTIQASASRSMLTAWLGAVAYMLQIYFDFSGYSDMAIGMGKMLGFDFLENFDHPYTAVSITDFWRKWHISLSSWFRDYVYIPLGGSRVKKERHILNLMIVWMLTGLWHGASWNFVLWGLYYGVLLVIEKYLLKDILEKMPDWGKHIYTLLLVLFGWVLFSNTDISAMGKYLANMFGIGASGLADAAFLYYFRSNLVLLALGILCCGKGMRKLYVRISEKLTPAGMVICAVLFLLSTAYLVYGSYNPFLYFRF